MQKYLLFLCVKLLTNGWNDDIILRDNNERQTERNTMLTVTYVRPDGRFNYMQQGQHPERINLDGTFRYNDFVNCEIVNIEADSEQYKAEQKCFESYCEQFGTALE